MGFLKQMKDLTSMAAEAPGLMAQSATLAANAQAMAAAQQAAPLAAPAAAGDDGPIAGVSLELYVSISKALAGVGYDAGQAPELAAAEGIAAADWDAAVAGWNSRMQANPAVAQRFNALYTGR